jgi:hypothetical protein
MRRDGNTNLGIKLKNANHMLKMGVMSLKYFFEKHFTK